MLTDRAHAWEGPNLNLDWLRHLLTPQRAKSGYSKRPNLDTLKGPLRGQVYQGGSDTDKVMCPILIYTLSELSGAVALN